VQTLTSSHSASTWSPMSMSNWAQRLWKLHVFAPTSEYIPYNDFGEVGRQGVNKTPKDTVFRIYDMEGKDV
jgi:hypothetical protein